MANAIRRAGGALCLRSLLTCLIKPRLHFDEIHRVPAKDRSYSPRLIPILAPSKPEAEEADNVHCAILIFEYGTTPIYVFDGSSTSDCPVLVGYRM